MGVPAFFRWLSKKYPSIVVHCKEEKVKQIDDQTLPVDISLPNPNDVEFDNLYLDMNGIIHPCCHPENKPAPQNEEEMMVDIFDYIDRIMSICRPRRLLYMAIDGVAPRAKMNQQRSRRFRAAKESAEKRAEISKIKDELREKGMPVPPEKPASSHFDSNCITPGTEFMFRLADCLRYYVHDRINNNPGWKNLKVILSDANVPGEGEHKIMDFIRKQRVQPSHDPNTHHILCGADADLIMLGLATHEVNFTIIREEFKPNQPRPCEICGQIGHEMKDCVGAEAMPNKDEKIEWSDTEFIFIRLNVLREYLEIELKMDNLPFKQDLERAIDDWVFMCFFVGNDFLPHLPSLSIREGAIDRLIKLYKEVVYKTKGYLTENGNVFLNRVQLMMTDLGKVEDEIFQKRRIDDEGFRRRNKANRKRAKLQAQSQKGPSFVPQGQFAPQPVGSSSTISNPRQEAAEMRQNAMKRKAEESDSDPEPEDNVRLWEGGWKTRYYTSKFGVDDDDIEFRKTVANEYVQGLCWVLLYYYQGCASWKWYFPYHYAPFASDFCNVGDLDCSFEKHTKPFQPLEQLMSVFPAASKKFLPPSWQLLMYEPDSPIIDFYPSDFKIDLNGKKFAWMGVALLPFVDEVRLKEALQTVYPDVTDVEKSRNTLGTDRLFVGKDCPAFAFCQSLYESPENESCDLVPTLAEGISGVVKRDEFCIEENGTYKSPISLVPDLPLNRTMTVAYSDPIYEEGYIFKAEILPNATRPARTINPDDFKRGRGGYNSRGYRPQTGFTPSSGHRGRGTYSTGTLERHVRHGLGGSQGANVPPPNSYNDHRSGYSRGGRSFSDQGRGSYQSHHGGGRGGYQQEGSFQRQGGYSQGGGYNQGSGGYNQSSGGYNQGAGLMRNPYENAFGSGYQQRGGGGHDRRGQGNNRSAPYDQKRQHNQSNSSYGNSHGGYSRGSYR